MFVCALTDGAAAGPALRQPDGVRGFFIAAARPHSPAATESVGLSLGLASDYLAKCSSFSLLMVRLCTDAECVTPRAPTPALADIRHGLAHRCSSVASSTSMTHSRPARTSRQRCPQSRHDGGSHTPRIQTEECPLAVRLCPQVDTFIVPSLLLSSILSVSVVGSLAFTGVLVAVQITIDAKNNAKLRRLKYEATGAWVVCKPLDDAQAFHLFLSHACTPTAANEDHL